jgi:hypothetical protein
MGDALPHPASNASAGSIDRDDLNPIRILTALDTWGQAVRGLFETCVAGRSSFGYSTKCHTP